MQALWVLSLYFIKIFKKMMVCLSGTLGFRPIQNWWWRHLRGPGMAGGCSLSRSLNSRLMHPTTSSGAALRCNLRNLAEAWTGPGWEPSRPPPRATMEGSSTRDLGTWARPGRISSLASLLCPASLSGPLNTCHHAFEAGDRFLGHGLKSGAQITIDW